MVPLYSKTAGWKILNLPRSGKKLVVLDLDRTLTDYFMKVDSYSRKLRPYLHYFLEEIYQFYDIIIWSSSTMKMIKRKLTKLGILNNQNYKILCYLGDLAMTRVKNSKFKFRTKPLSIIWKRFRQYNASNTVIIDDKRKNFYCNPKNGIAINKYYAVDYERDQELFFLLKYLKNIQTCCNFEELKNSDWKDHLNN